MPNWCANEAYLVHEDESRVDALEQFLKTQDGSDMASHGLLHYLLPTSRGAQDGSPDQCVQEWGTDRDVRMTGWTRHDIDTILIRFDSAWTPPIAAYQSLERSDGWQITAMYHEPGVSLIGKFDGGTDSPIEYDFSDENWREGIDEELLDWAGLESDYEAYLESEGDSDS